MKISLLCVFIFLPYLLAAQFWRNKTIAPNQDSFLIDSLPVLLPTVSLFRKGQIVPDSVYKVENNRLILSQRCPDSLLISYKITSYALYNPVYRKDSGLIGKKSALQNTLFGNGYAYNPYKSGENNPAFESKGMDYNGNFTRGISVGNRQDLVTNSSLNLQLSGKVGGVEISAALSDNNVPLQPNGNSQQLQDFDKMFISFKIDSQQLIGGDFNLDNPNYSYFSRYTRRLQGAKLLNYFPIDSQKRLHNQAAVALARGKFGRNLINGQEGNQGPYKLTGNNGETFLILIAGTERVFIDGQQLTRGADNDYVIDYNLAEIRFTNKRLISKDSRIQVEFSYNDLNYNRSLWSNHSVLETGKQRFYLDIFSEQDIKNQPANQILNDTSRALLADAGDSLNNAFFSSIQRVERSPDNLNILYYKLIDSFVIGQNIRFDSVLVYAPTDSQAVYTAQFSLVGAGNGDYIRSINNLNGAVYQWVSPDSAGRKRGNYAPVRLLIAPKKQQIFSAGYQLKTKTQQLNADAALSNYDLNSFASKGNQDNAGAAAKLQFSQQIRLNGADSGQNKQLFAQVGGFYEYVSARFVQLEPYRSREFSRDWNVSNLAKTAEHWAGASLDFYNHQKTFNAQFSSSFLLKDSLYQGLRQGGKLGYKNGNFSLNGNVSYLSSQSRSNRSGFFRPNLQLAYQLPRFYNIGFFGYFEQERNLIQNLIGGGLGQGWDYKIYKIAAQLPAIKGWELKSHFQIRTDDSLKINQLGRFSTAYEGNFYSRYNPNPQQSLEINFNSRHLVNNDSLFAKIRPSQTYLSRSEYNHQHRKNLFRLNLIYELSNGQQQQTEYNFIKTDKGAGTHIWIDRNSDGIAQLSEFEQSAFADQADYIKLNVLSPNFIKTQNASYSQSVDFQLKPLFAKKSKDSLSLFGRALSKISLRSVWRVDKKQLQGSVGGINPFSFDLADNGLIYLQNNLQNSLFFNRNNPNFNAELGQSWQTSRNFLTIGFESRGQKSYNLLYRCKLSKRWNGSQTLSLGDKIFDSQLLSGRNYQIRYYSVETQINALPKPNLRIQGKFLRKNQQNLLPTGEKALENRFSVELNYNKSGSWNVRGSLSYSKISYEGANNSPVQFALLEGLQNGNNLLWSLGLDKPVSAFMQFSVSYEGRKIPDSQLIHVGKMQLRAIF